MRNRLLLIVLPIIIFLATSMVPQGTATDFLSLPGPVKFDGNDYHLAWSSHPNSSYYKHEYVQKADNPERFKSMVMIEAIVGDIDVKDAVNSQIKTIEARKKTDAVARYELIENSDKNEAILDFVMSESQNGKVTIVEWNTYRYSKFRDASGHTGLMLFAISKRGYNAGVKDFFATLKESRGKWVNELAAYNLPVINIKK